MIEIYTDGACSKNPGLGAYAAIILTNNKKEIISEFKKHTTNQEMELLATLNALKVLKTIKELKQEINLYSDSKYVIDGMSSWMHGWAKNNWSKDIAHKQIWQEIYKIYKNIKINCIWVKGHANIKYNEECDKIAKDLIKTEINKNQTTNINKPIKELNQTINNNNHNQQPKIKNTDELIEELN